MSERIVPQDLAAEEALIGAALIRQQVVNDLVGFIDPSDFYKPSHQQFWEVMIGLHATGQAIDMVTVGAHFTEPATKEELRQCWLATPAVTQAGRYAKIIVELSRRRRLMHHYLGLYGECYEKSADEVLAMDDPRSDRLIIRNNEEGIEGLMGLGEFMAEAALHEAQGEWLLPHIVRELWRIIIVAGEGVGKATLMRFLGLCAAAGRDPWNTSQAIVPRRVLYVDVENAKSTIAHQVKLAHVHVDFVEECEDRYFIWGRESGLNLRDRRVQAEFESVLQDVRPEIVFAGPLYKLFRRKGMDDMEQATIELLEVLDDWRVRYNFAVVLEHHAPKGSGGYREMNPFGSSALMRWPEFGITLEPIGNPLPHELAMTLEVGRFRRDREPADWPAEISRGQMGQQAAWKPRFPNGRNRQGFT